MAVDQGISQQPPHVYHQQRQHIKMVRQEYGVPQRSILSSTLFRIFINKAARMLSPNPLTNGVSTKLVLYADNAVHTPNIDLPDWTRRFRTGLFILHKWSMQYCQQFHPGKSQIVWFIRQQHFVAPFTFSLGTFDLVVVPTYRYLGLHLDANFSWKSHCKELMVRAQFDAYYIRRLIDFEIDASMHFCSVWLLCLAYLLPRWTFGAPFIRAVDWWTHRLQSLLSGVVRKVLALPMSTHILSVLVDANLLPLKTFNQYQILRAAHNMAALPPTHAVNKIFTHNYSISAQTHLRAQFGVSAPRQPAKIRAFTDNLLQLE